MTARIELFMAHGTGTDPVTPYDEALEMQDIYSDIGVHSELATIVQPDGVRQVMVPGMALMAKVCRSYL